MNSFVLALRQAPDALAGGGPSISGQAMLTVFVVVQFVLSQEVTGKDKALEQLNAKIAQLNDLLSLEKLGKLALVQLVGLLGAGLLGLDVGLGRRRQAFLLAFLLTGFAAVAPEPAPSYPVKSPNV